MRDDKDLINKLNAQLLSIQDKLGANGNKICERELSRIQNIFQQISNKFQKSSLRNEESPFLEVLLTLKNVLKGIDDEGRLLEKEMRGVDNYSHYEYINVINFAHKKDLKEELIKMLLTIRAERPELKGKEPFISI